MTRPSNAQPDSRLLALAAMQPRDGAPRLGADELAGHAATLDGWIVQPDRIVKVFEFPDFTVTMAFVNAIAWVAMRADHHPDLRVGYDRCEVAWSTHSAGGVTLNDVICAAKVDRLLR
jgi:4a-hydroxytetrahydrobiopterin dehydratase